MHVMLVDDDPFILSMLKVALVKWGHKVSAYTNPGRCPLYCSSSCPCPLYQDGCPDLVLTDVNMPTVNGMKFAEAIKNKCCNAPKIGMMSGDWSEADLRKAVHIGATVFSKPFNLPSLRSWLSTTAGSAPLKKS